MRNPLMKRIRKELRDEFGKYIILFLFLVLTIGFVSGFLVSGESMQTAYDESFIKYNIEYGNFESASQLEDTVCRELEQAKTKLYENFYIERKTKTNKGTTTLRIFKVREQVNKVCVMKGKLPKAENEIAIDRMYADNNGIKTGDTIDVAGEKLSVTGLVALSDYSALYADPSDLMFDSILFGVAVVTEDKLEDMGQEGLHFSYSWLYDKEPEDEIQEKEMSDEFLNVLAQKVVLERYLPRYSNQAIQITGDDLGGDTTMMTVLLYILIVIIAFIFAISTSNTITKEAAVIGTLRASGYTRGELVRHYLAMPVIVTFAACVVGNILGYTVFKNMTAALYYQSYSLPTYETIWNGDAFIKTTIVPFVFMLVINIWILSRKMRIEPLRFLRNNLSKSKEKAVKLPNFRFMTRFQLRILFQNIPSYVTLFIGIAFASVILLFGMMMTPLLEHYKSDILEHKLAGYQYALKIPVKTKTEGAEPYVTTVLKIAKEDGEEISVYGIQEKSRYVDIKIPENGVYITRGYAQKYLVKTGDTIKLKEQYGKKTYKFRVKGIYPYAASISVFMNQKDFWDTFDMEDGYFNGYFSNREIKDIDKKAIAATITIEDLTKTCRQLETSMGEMFSMINVFSVTLYMLIIFLLSKLIIEKNANAISMVKILGYENMEIRKLYMQATTIVVFLSLIVGTGAAVVTLKAICRPLMAGYSGWMPLYIPFYVYAQMLGLGLASYIAVEFILYRRIKKVPMEEALKHVD